MRAVAVRTTVAVVLASAAAGCGGAAQRGPRPSPAAPPRSGPAVFAAACAGCHTLGRARRPAMGGDLSGYTMPPAVVARFARVMPTPRPLTRAQLDAVAGYVAAVQRRSAGRR